ncbi:MAG: DUF2142 domain-containing protein [Chloroflexota bacterium]
MTRTFHPLVGLVALTIALAAWTSVHVPLFEAPDAYHHYAVVEHLARTGELPPRAAAASQPWRQMAYHAPLYYALGAVITAPLDTHDFLTDYRPNPHAQIGEPDAGDNVNFVAHLGDPWRDTGLAARLVRMISAALAGVTVAGVYAISRVLLRGQRRVALVAAALVAFNPQFVFIHASVSNDTLVIALTTLTLALTLAMMRWRLTTGGIIGLALLVALASIAKASGLALLPPVALGMLWACRRQGVPAQRTAAYALTGALIWLGIAGWWYVWNWSTLGNPTGTEQIAAVTGARVGGIQDLVGELRGLAFSFWGLFGWFNVRPPLAFYLLPGAIALAAMVGMGLYGRQIARGLRTPFGMAAALLLLLYGLIFVGSWWHFHQMVNAAQGRLFFPLLGLIAPALAYGLTRLPRAVPALAVAGLGLAAVALPPLVIAPAYATAPPSAAADTWAPPADAIAYVVREPWREASCLTLVTRPVTWDGEAQPIAVDVWWLVACPIEGQWSVFTHFVDVALETCEPGVTDYILAQHDTMPQGGRLPGGPATGARLAHSSGAV